MDGVPALIAQYTVQKSAVHDSLRASRRRLVIALLVHRKTTIGTGLYSKSTTQTDAEADSDVPVGQLAREIVAIEEDIVIEHATGPPYHNVYTALIQTHLPKLDDIGAIDYNDDRKTVAPDRNLTALAMAAATTSPVTQLLFDRSAAELHSGGIQSPQDSIND